MNTVTSPYKKERNILETNDANIILSYELLLCNKSCMKRANMYHALNLTLPSQHCPFHKLIFRITICLI